MTTTPNDQLADLHDRMPVVLPDDAWEPLARPRIPRMPAELHALFEPDRRHRAPASTRSDRDVNDVRRDGPDLIEPVDPDPGPDPGDARDLTGRGGLGGRAAPRVVAKAAAGSAPPSTAAQYRADQRADAVRPSTASDRQRERRRGGIGERARPGPP